MVESPYDHLSAGESMSVQEKVVVRIKRLPKGHPFSIAGFYELGNRSAVQKALSRLVTEGMITRVERGIYCRPKPLNSMPFIKQSANAEQVARLWARENSFKLVPHGQEEAYRLGLQTQAPIAKLFWTNGPSREFRVGNQRVIVKHARRSLLVWPTKPEGRLLRGLSVLKQYEVPESAMQTAFQRLHLSKHEASLVLRKLSASEELHRFCNKFSNLA